MKQNFADHHGAAEMSSRKRGQLVWLPSSRVEARRSYSVNTLQGQVRQNRRDILDLPQNTSTSSLSPVKETSTSRVVPHRSTRESHPPQ